MRTSFNQLIATRRDALRQRLAAGLSGACGRTSLRSGRLSLRSGRLSRRSQQGISLTEILIVVAIIGIMALFSMPAMMDFFRSMKVRTGAQRLASHMRLARQVAVSRRIHVTFVVEGGTALSTYRAWEDIELDQVRDANGVDNIMSTDDDEPWVVRPVFELSRDDVDLKAVYNDTTPATIDDTYAAEDSLLDGDGELILRFYPDGQVLRLNADGDPVQTDTLIRIRLDGLIGPQRIDRFYGSVNRPGKVQTDFIRNPSWS